MYGQKGFTVIEVSIFLAISGLLIVIAFAGTSRLISGARFTDGVRTLESYVQRQYEEVSSGVNERNGLQVCSNAAVSNGSSAPGTSSCVLLGKAIIFSSNSSQVQTRYVVGYQGLSPIDPTQSASAAIAAFTPTIVTTVNASSFVIPWQITFSGATRQDGNVDVKAVAFLRSPNSSEILTYLYNGTPTNPLTLTSTVNTVANSSTSAIFCLKDDSTPAQKAALEFTNGQGSSSINALFEPARARC